MLGCLSRLGFTEFNEKAVNFVVFHAKRGEAGGGFFTCFKLNEELAGIVAQCAQLIELGIESRADDVTVPKRGRRLILKGACESVLHGRIKHHAAACLLKPLLGTRREQQLQLSDHGQRITKRSKLLGTYGAQCDA